MKRIVLLVVFWGLSIGVLCAADSLSFRQGDTTVIENVSPNENANLPEKGCNSISGDWLIAISSILVALIIGIFQVISSPSLCYALYLAPLTLEDSEETCNKKIDIVAHFLENFAVRRSTNYRLFSASSIRYTMCNLVKTIRGKDIAALKEALISETEEIKDFNESLPVFRLHGMNRCFIKYFLARITSFVEEGSGMGNHFVNYMRNPNQKPFEVEHIWSEHFEWHEDEFKQTEEFNQWRNSIGDLILLPNGVNQSYNDMPVVEKLPHYIKENILAQSFCASAYEKNPSFKAFITKRRRTFWGGTSCYWG